MRALLAYVPVLHRGYLDFFKTHTSAERLYVLGDDYIEEFHPLHTEIRALDPKIAAQVIRDLGLFSEVIVLTEKTLKEIETSEIIATDDATIRAFVNKYLMDTTISFEKYFLRWDEKNVKSDSTVNADRISHDPQDRMYMERADDEAKKSACWWRNIGAVIVKDDAVIATACNTHVPSEHSAYADGDPRDVVKAGTEPDLYNLIHAEQALIADAARTGQALDGAHLYINVFPCPPCAKFVARAGIKKVFFKTGSAWLDAESVLRAHKIEIIRVQ
jgi:dCMP deaminase